MRFENPTRGGRLARLVQALLIGAVLVLAGGTPASAQEVLTNESVVGMVKAGLPESVIIQKIRSAARKFDTSTDGLIKLKRARITDKEPVFTTPQPAQQWILARLKPGKQDRNLPMSKNDGWGWGGATFRDGVDPKYAVKLVAEPGQQGLTKLRPEQPLAPGEYGFIAVTRGQPNMVEVFDFGVD